MLSFFKRFRHYNLCEYSQLLETIFYERGLKDILDKYNKITIAPVNNPYDITIVKSGDHLVYPLKILIQQERRVSVYDYRFNSQGKCPDKFNDSILVILDDFSGSGNSIIKCLNTLKHQSFSEIIVVSLVCQRQSIELLQEVFKKENIFYAHQHSKQIDDLHSKSKSNKIKRRIKRITSRFGLNATYTFGYEDSQALLTMADTPNNTVGLFWLKGKKWKGPYKRKMKGRG